MVLEFPPLRSNQDSSDPEGETSVDDGGAPAALPTGPWPLDAWMHESDQARGATPGSLGKRPLNRDSSVSLVSARCPSGLR